MTTFKWLCCHGVVTHWILCDMCSESVDPIALGTRNVQNDPPNGNLLGKLSYPSRRGW